jgi:large subunit ribosomal protein L18
MSKMMKFLKPFWLDVTLSNKHISAQIVHKPTGSTITTATTKSKELKLALPKTSDKNAAAAVGILLAKKAQEMGVHAVSYEVPQGKTYHGKLKAVIDAVVEGGLKLI